MQARGFCVPFLLQAFFGKKDLTVASLYALSKYSNIRFWNIIKNRLLFFA